MKQKSEDEGTERVRLGKGVGQGRRPENTRLKAGVKEIGTVKMNLDSTESITGFLTV